MDGGLSAMLELACMALKILSMISVKASFSLVDDYQIANSPAINQSPHMA